MILFDKKIVFVVIIVCLVDLVFSSFKWVNKKVKIIVVKILKKFLIYR